MRVVWSIALVLLGPALPAVAGESCRDCIRPEIAERVAPEVRYQRTPVAPADDGYVPLRLAAQLVRNPGLSKQPSACELQSAPTEDDVQAVGANLLSLWLFEEAAAKPAFQWVPFQVGDESFHRYRQVFLLAILQARIDTAAGDSRGAADRLGAALALARKTSRGDAQLIHALVGLYIERTILAEILCLAARENGDADLVERLAAAVASGPAPCAVYSQALRVELGSFWLPNVQELEASGQWHGPPLPEAAQLAGDALKAHLVACGTDAGLPCTSPPEGVEFNPGAYDAAFWRAGAELTATQTILALRLYKLRFGHLPASLDELPQSGVPAPAPRDPYTAAPFVYDAASGEIQIEMPLALRDCPTPRASELLKWSIGEP